MKETIKKREGKIRGAVYELRALTEDYRMQAVGGCQSALDLYESCLIPSLLTNAGTWVEISEEAIKMLDRIQDTFGRVLLALPLSAQGASLRAALGLLGMKWRVWELKIHLIQAIRRQEEGGLAREVLEEQLEMDWPGLASEVRDICKEIMIPDASRRDIEKETIKKAIIYDHVKSLKKELTGDKLKDMSNSDVSKRREYTGWSVQECRMAFRLETRMFVCRANMPTLYKRDLTCRACTTAADRDGPGPVTGPVEDQEHLECCPGYASQWAGLGPMTPRTRVNYFLRVDTIRRKAAVTK